jgi:mRNA interferase HigB
MLIKFWEKHKDAEIPLRMWFKKVVKSKWKSINDIKKEFPTADYVGDNRVVFDIKGNRYRIVVLIFFDGQKAYIRFIGTHAEYDKIKARTI